MDNKEEIYKLIRDGYLPEIALLPAKTFVSIIEIENKILLKKQEELNYWYKRCDQAFKEYTKKIEENRSNNWRKRHGVPMRCRRRHH